MCLKMFEETYKLVSVRKVAVYPDRFIEGKIELYKERHGECRKYVYLLFDIDDVEREISVRTDFWCYYFPIDDMYDNTKFIYDIETDEAVNLMKQIQQMWRS